jgi:hypothetical protein
VRYTPDGKHLVSAGGAPRNAGFLAVWSAEDGKMLFSSEPSAGTLFALALSKDGKLVALGTGGSVRAAAGGEVNNGFVITMPALK